MYQHFGTTGCFHFQDRLYQCLAVEQWKPNYIWWLYTELHKCLTANPPAFALTFTIKSCVPVNARTISDCVWVHDAGIKDTNCVQEWEEHQWDVGYLAGLRIQYWHLKQCHPHKPVTWTPGSGKNSVHTIRTSMWTDAQCELSNSEVLLCTASKLTFSLFPSTCNLMFTTLLHVSV
jgi:hypothetical protein